jgi:hypothetical protein
VGKEVFSVTSRSSVEGLLMAGPTADGALSITLHLPTCKILTSSKALFSDPPLWCWKANV